MINFISFFRRSKVNNVTESTSDAVSKEEKIVSAVYWFPPDGATAYKFQERSLGAAMFQEIVSKGKEANRTSGEYHIELYKITDGRMVLEEKMYLARPPVDLRSILEFYFQYAVIG